ncbi:MAG: hypothetical protein QOH50_4867 [Kribbellaceae bacterium]|nr:hypothetical protein [Kribbellaceae bacterium]
MSNFDPWAPYEEAVERQAIFLRNPLPPGQGVCRICRAAANGSYGTCFPCSQHVRATGSTADAVVPVAYALKGTQHAHNLASYKFAASSRGAQAALLSLGLVFLRWHRSCLEAAAGGRFTHAVVVPSTSGRQGLHPLQKLLGPSTSLPTLQVTSHVAYPADDRTFHADRFTVGSAPPEARVLLLDDTWTTGARVQSLSHALKSAGARSVVAVVLGRHVNAAHEGSKALVDRAREGSFDIRRCVLDS